MNKLQNDSLIKAFFRQPVARTPIWIMRQAGRYLPEYRALREKTTDFLQFCQTPDLACEATLQPLRRFDLDAAIVFSDILTVPAAMGMELHFQKGEGPCFPNPIRSLEDVTSLATNIQDKLSYVFTTIEKVVTALNGQVPVIGFAGSPWTVACYMIDGQGSKTFHQTKTMLYQQPQILENLLERLTQATITYLNAQIAAGARAIMLFDTWGGILTTTAYQKFSLYYMAKIAANLQRVFDHQTIPIIFFTKQGGQWLELMAESGCDAVGLDWTIDIQAAKKRIGAKVALQGNLDPAILFSTPDIVQQEARQLMQQYGGNIGHVFNLGHGIDPSTPIENVAALVDAVHGVVRLD